MALQDYNSIGESFLMKVEEVVAKTATGHSPVLTGYYHFWERSVYNAIAQMAIRSMAALMGLLQCKDSPPLFKVGVFYVLGGPAWITHTGAISKPSLALYPAVQGTPRPLSSPRSSLLYDPLSNQPLTPSTPLPHPLYPSASPPLPHCLPPRL